MVTSNRIVIEMDESEYDRMRAALGKAWEWRGLVRLILDGDESLPLPRRLQERLSDYYTVCPDCEGQGFDEIGDREVGFKRVNCEKCRNRGYVPAILRTR